MGEHFLSQLGRENLRIPQYNPETKLAQKDQENSLTP